MGERLLVVQPRNLPSPSLAGRLRLLSYAFVERDSGDGFSAWPVSEADTHLDLDVQAHCAEPTGNYRQHAMNRWVAREILGFRPAVVVLRGYHGCVLDLLRIARLLKVPALLDTLGVAPPEAEPSIWLRDCLASADAVVGGGALPAWWPGPVSAWHAGPDLSGPLETLLDRDHARPAESFTYATYEFLQRDQPLLMRMQADEVSHFQSCHRVLDLGCGAGLFLQLLQEQGIAAVGVERDADIAAYGRGTGMDIVTADALDFLGEASGFDGIYCSHFVEHLPVDAAQSLLARAAKALDPGGVLVMVFPDPESIRSQLLGFWRDPEHVRFYHPELVEAMALVEGLRLEWSSHDHPPRQVGPFPWAPEPLPEWPATGYGEPGTAIDGDTAAAPAERTDSAPRTVGWWERIIASLGLAPRGQVAELRAELEQQRAALAALDDRARRQVAGLAGRTEQLWVVNQTWAWPDNAVLRFRKPAAGE